MAAATLLGLSGVAQAALTAYTDETSFMAAVTNAGTDDFTGLPANDLGNLVSRSTTTNIYTYDATSPVELHLFGLPGTPAWLTVDTPGSSLYLSNFGGGVKAVGGMFFITDVLGTPSGGSLTLTAFSGGKSESSTVYPSTTSSFVGFVSDGLMTSLAIVADHPSDLDPKNPSFFYQTVGKLVLASAVPEPETYALMLAGLGLVGFMARRRHG